MDLGLYLRVIWRFRILVLGGLFLASILAFLSVARVEVKDGRPQATYRDPHIYESESLLLVTQRGFPIGRAVFDEVLPTEPRTDEGGYVHKYSEPERYSPYAILYAHLFMSDDVQRLIRQEEDIKATVRADPVMADINTVFPEIQIKSVAETPGDARRGARQAVAIFRSYIAEEQAANQIIPEKRIVLQVLNTATEPELVSAPPLTRPAVVFLAVMSAIFGLVFVLENLRPRIFPVRAGDALRTQATVEDIRRSA